MTPIDFVTDSREKWRPAAVDASLAATRPIGLGGTLAATTIDHSSQLVSGLERLNFPADMTQPKHLEPVAHIHDVQAGNLWWRQWWLWYLYNPWNVAGVGEHEGDWETVQIGYSDRTR